MIAQPQTVKSHSHGDGGFRICSGCKTSYFLGTQPASSFCEPCLFTLALQPLDSVPRDDLAVSIHPSDTPQVFGSYFVQEEIGRGGMGIIFRALRHDTGEIVALKTVLPQLAACAETLARFEREAEAAASLVHPHTLPIYEVGHRSDGVPFFAMKLALGGSLHQLVGKYRGRWRQIAELIIKIATAVQHAHDQGILHRDLKPGNILFTEDHEPMITDFGLSKRFTGSDSLTHSCTILGTPSYVAPEQAAGKTKHLTPATDIFSLGAIFFELLTGRPPFIGNNALDVLRQVAERTPVRPSSLAPAVPKTLEAVCMRCLERQPEDRYHSAQAVADDLTRWLQGKKVATRPVRPWLRRKPGPHLVKTAWCVGSIALGLAVWWGERNFEKKAEILEHAVSVAVAIEDLDQGLSHGDSAKWATDELNRGMAQTGAFRVIEPKPADFPLNAEVFNPLVYARSANAQTVLTGTIRHSGGDIRLVTRLLRSDTGEVIWRGVDVLPAKDPLSAMPAAGKRIVDVLRNKWQANPTTFSRVQPLSTRPEALAFYTKARELANHTNPNDLKDAVGLFQRAVELDHNFVLARAMLAYAYWMQATFWGESDKLPLALKVGLEAIAQDPNSAEAHRAVGSCYIRTAHYPEALKEFWAALELDPQSASCNFSIGACLREIGRPEQAIPWLTRAMQYDPAHGAFSCALAETLGLIHCDAQAEAALLHALELDPEQPDALAFTSILRAWQQQYESARKVCTQVELRFPNYRYRSNNAALIEFFAGESAKARALYNELREKGNYEQSWECFGAVNPSSALACLAKQEGRISQAQLLAQEAIDTDQKLLLKYPANSRILHDLAATWAVLGDVGRSIRYLKEAIAAGWVEQRSTAIDPRFRLLTGNPEFKAALDRDLPKSLQAKQIQ